MVAIALDLQVWLCRLAGGSQNVLGVENVPPDYASVFTVPFAAGLYNGVNALHLGEMYASISSWYRRSFAGW